MYKAMRIIIIAAAILALALLVFLYAPEPNLGVSATDLDNGVKIENTGNVACLVFVSSLEGEQRFELAIGQSIVVTNITKPIGVSAVSK